MVVKLYSNLAMNEIERILDKGLFSEEFLLPEYSCDFYVDEKRKRHWLVLLDILFEIDNLCRDNDIQYSLFFGSLLGAVRHKGFIPWDDDLDIAMPRKDYENFLKLGTKLPPPLFLQTPFTDNGFFYTMAKVRNSNTTAVVDCFKYEKFNQGIYIDIFPLDSYNDICLEDKYNIVHYLILDLSAYMRSNNPELDDVQKKRVESFSNRDPFVTYNMIHALSRADERMKCKYTGVLSSWIYGPKPNKQTYPANFWNEFIKCDFHGLQVPIPKRFDEVLRVTYGDYMKLPPLESRGQWHSGIIVDTDRTYLDYLK